MALVQCLLSGQPSTPLSGKQFRDHFLHAQLPYQNIPQLLKANGGNDRSTIRCDTMSATANRRTMQLALCEQRRQILIPRKHSSSLNAVKNDVAAESENVFSGGLMGQAAEEEGGRFEESVASSRKMGFRIVEAKTPEDVRAAATLRSIAFFTLPKDRAGAYADVSGLLR